MIRLPRSIQLAGAVLALCGGAVLLWRSMGQAADSGADAPEGTLWLCRRAECGREFVLSTKDLGEFYDKNPGATPPCPACAGSENARAIRCTGCKKAIVPPARSSSEGAAKARVCPHCGKAIG